MPASEPAPVKPSFEPGLAVAPRSRPLVENDLNDFARTPIDPLTVWLTACAAEDRQAFQHLYEATKSKLFGVAMLMVRRRDVAEDVLQEAYMRIWAGARQFNRERGEPLPWLAQIVRNAAVDRLRRDRMVHDDIEEHQSRLSCGSPRDDERLDLARLVASLEPSRRCAMLLSALYGYTNEEVAARIGVPLGTAKTWIRRSKQRLRDRLAG